QHERALDYDRRESLRHAPRRHPRRLAAPLRRAAAAAHQLFPVPRLPDHYGCEDEPFATAVRRSTGITYRSPKIPGLVQNRLKGRVPPQHGLLFAVALVGVGIALFIIPAVTAKIATGRLQMGAWQQCW